MTTIKRSTLVNSAKQLLKTYDHGKDTYGERHQDNHIILSNTEEELHRLYPSVSDQRIKSALAKAIRESYSQWLKNIAR